jgi:hypothetical protein
VGQALATEAIAECIRSGGVGEAESNIELLGLVPTPAAADWDASVTVEPINLWENTAKASRRKCEFDQMREVLFVREAGDLALATSHLDQSSSASRFTAGAFAFFHFEPIGGAPGTLDGILALRDDALKAYVARVAKHDVAWFVDVCP